jgi:hypothetical protein
LLAPPFAPAACWCARITLPSTNATLQSTPPGRIRLLLDRGEGPPNANADELLKRVLGSWRADLRQAAVVIDQAISQRLPPAAENTVGSVAPPGRRRAQEGRAQRLARYDVVVTLQPPKTPALRWA